MNAVADHAAFAQAVRVAPPAVAKSNRAERVFGLHPALYAGMFGCFFAYLGIMWAAFGNAELALPFVIFAVSIAGGYIVPAYWAKVAETDGPKDSWSAFLRDGFQCQTGHVAAPAVIAQVMIMPVMLLAWGMIVAVIAATA